MKTSKNIVKIIFGLKVNQYRIACKKSLDDLSNEISISKSYLNEIEKGKKYPQADKIMKLASALNVSYDNLVALKLDGELEPLTNLLLSDTMQRVPLKALGLNEETLSTMLLSNPKNTQIMLSTLLNVSIKHNLDKKEFMMSILQSHLESYHYYFPELENSVEKKRIKLITKYNELNLKNAETILLSEYKIKLKILNQEDSDKIENIQSIFIDSKKILLLNYYTNDTQRLFLILREIGHQENKPSDRVYIFPSLNYDNFDQIKHDVEATHYSHGLLIPREHIIDDVSIIFRKTEYNQDYFVNLIDKYNVTPFVLLRRVASLMKNTFNINQFFLMSLKNEIGTKNFDLNFEIRFIENQFPDVNPLIHHYCRKSATKSVLNSYDPENKTSKYFMKTQISRLHLQGNITDFLTFSIIEDNPIEKNYKKCLSLSLLIDSHASKTIRFINDPNIPIENISVICEICPVENCSERRAKANILTKNIELDLISKNLNEIINSF